MDHGGWVGRGIGIPFCASELTLCARIMSMRETSVLWVVYRRCQNSLPLTTNVHGTILRDARPSACALNTNLIRPTDGTNGLL